LAVELSPTSGGMYRDGSSGSSGGDDDGSKGDGIGGGDECAGGAMLLTRRSPTEGGDSETGGDGDGVVMARSLSTSASSGRDMEAMFPQVGKQAHAHPRPEELAVSVDPLGLIPPHHRLPRRLCQAQSRCRRKCR
ncbi:hypothetical protein Tco_0220565, partial [Tanacetum coccineum]